MRQRTKRSRIAPMLVGAPFLLFVMLPTTQVAAYNTYDDHRLTFGIVNEEYWLSTGAAQNYPSAIFDGIGAWNASATPASWSRTMTKADSHMDWYSAEIGAACAGTQFWVNSAIVEPEDQDWWWTRLYIDPSFHSTTLCSATVAHRQGITAHEVGHAMGLDHVNPIYDYRLMYEGIAATNVNTPQPDEVAGINYLY